MLRLRHCVILFMQLGPKQRARCIDEHKNLTAAAAAVIEEKLGQNEGIDLTLEKFINK